MPSKRSRSCAPPAARAFVRLQAEDALLPAEASALRKSSAIFLAMLMLAAVPVFWAANAAGVIGDVPAAVAKGGGAGDDDDGRLGPGDGDDADDREFLRTDNTSGNNNSTRGTTRDHDTKTNTKGGTNDTSRPGKSTRGTTRDNDTRSNTLNSATNSGGGGATNNT
jgi:hypothetical protein